MTRTNEFDADEVTSSFEEVETPVYDEHEREFEGVHELGDRRIVRKFTLAGGEITADAYYFLDGSRLDGVREGTAEVEDAERNAGDLEAFCRKWHARSPADQLTDDFDEVLGRNRKKAWVQVYLERQGSSP